MKNLIVTLANRNYVDQAKQLFSSVYFNAGWREDYMLLGQEIPNSELEWFRKRGILIKEVCPLASHLNDKSKIALSKIELFRSEMKRWKNIIFLDSDIIVRAPLNELTKVRGFAAVKGIYSSKLKGRFRMSQQVNTKDAEIQLRNLEEKYDLAQPGFNGGVYAFSTEFITDNTYWKLLNLFRKYENVITENDESVLGLFFYRKWIQLPLTYNTYVNQYELTNTKRCLGLVLHFLGQRPQDKPWSPKNPYYEEWKENLEKAEQMDIQSLSGNVREWSKAKMIKCSVLLQFKFMIFKLKNILRLACLGNK